MSSNFTDYSPIIAVRNFHNLPHLSPTYERQSSTFDLTLSSSIGSDYVLSIIMLPATLAALGIFLVIVLQITLCIRACISWFSIGQHLSFSNAVISLQRTTKKPLYFDIERLKWLFIGVIFISFIIVIADNSIFFGNYYLSKAVNDVQDSTNSVYDTFSDLTTYGNALNSDGMSLLNEFNHSQCSSTVSISSYMISYFAAVNDYLSYVSPLPSKISQVQDGIHTWGVKYKVNSIWTIYGMTMATWIVFVSGVLLKGRRILRISIGWTNYFVCCVFALSGITMVILVSILVIYFGLIWLFVIEFTRWDWLISVWNPIRMYYC